MPKKYYWLKLKADFFNSKEIKKLRKTAGGDTFVIIYLKMQLLSLQNGGKIFYDGVEDDFVSEIALTLDEDVENVRLTVAFLQNCKLIECTEVDEYFMTAVPDITGKECDSAERVRKHRSLHCNTDVTDCNTEKEIEIDIEKDLDSEKKKEADKSDKPARNPSKKKYGEYGHVKLKDEEYSRLCNDYSEKIILDYIRKMDEWIQLKGKNPYKDFNLALRKWLNRDNMKGSEENGKSDGEHYNGIRLGGGITV